MKITNHKQNQLITEKEELITQLNINLIKDRDTIDTIKEKENSFDYKMGAKNWDITLLTKENNHLKELHATELKGKEELLADKISRLQKMESRNLIQRIFNFSKNK